MLMVNVPEELPVLRFWHEVIVKFGIVVLITRQDFGVTVMPVANGVKLIIK